MKLTILLLLSSLTLCGQTIKGVVMEATTNIPIENVSIYYTFTKQGATTDVHGTFHLKINARIKSTDSISFSRLGYIPKKIPFSVFKAAKYIVYLLVKTENLNEVIIQSSKILKQSVSFKKLASLNTGVHSFGSKIINGNIYVVGGDVSYMEETEKRLLDELSNTAGSNFSDFIRKSRSNFSWENYSGKLQLYNIAKNTWTTASKKFRKRAYHTINYHNNKLYVLGGKRFSKNKRVEYLEDKIETYDLQSNKITIDHTNPHQAVNSQSFMYNNCIVVIGGAKQLKKNGKKVFTKTIHLYDLTSGLWFRLSDMPSAKELKGVLVKNTIYFIGGFNNKPISTIESYNLITGEWNQEGTLFSPIEKPALTYHDKTIYIFNDGNISTYNILTKTLNEYNIDLSIQAAALHYYNDKLYIIGGFRKYEFSKSTASGVFSININAFENTKIIRSKVNNF